ncbi:MAG: DEAD/DEAH box helicase [Planctomycetota bacterium]
MPELRWYQTQAVEALYRALGTKNPSALLSLPTGSGKSWIIAQLCTDTAVRCESRALVLAHRKELLEQNVEKIRALAPDLEVGLYSAGLRRRDTKASVIVAGVQSVYTKAEALGSFDLVVIDEAHLIPASGVGMYRHLIDTLRRVNPGVVFVGLTATPYRLDSGLLWGEDQLFESLTWEIGVKELIAGGFLCPRVSRSGTDLADTSAVTVRGGDFDAGELEDLMSQDRHVHAACREIISLTRGRKKVLLFASGVRHAFKLSDTLRLYGESSEAISGECGAYERGRVLREFCEGDLKYLTNCNILTTGFDAPHIDCIALLRPTKSAALYVQMVGRGLRTHPGKQDCLVLDYGENIRRHGPIDQMRSIPSRHIVKPESANECPVKACPKCEVLVAVGFSRCPNCDFEFPGSESKLEDTASRLAPLSAESIWHDVVRVEYSSHTKRDDPSAPKSLRVDYHLGVNRKVSEFICLEHGGFAAKRARDWWRARSSGPTPRTIVEALTRTGQLSEPKRLHVKEDWGRKWPSIIGSEFPDADESVVDSSAA